MSFLPMPRQFSTGTSLFEVPRLSGSPRDMASFDVNVTDVECLAEPSAPNIGR